MDNELGYLDVLAARKAFAEGRNVTEVLRRQKNVTSNTPDIIEAAYELQAGSYIDYLERNPGPTLTYAAEAAALLDAQLAPGASLLDVGSGELTTLSLIVGKLTRKPSRLYAFDISWSRLYRGLSYARTHMGEDFDKLSAFVADMSHTPLGDKSVDVTTSSHALEPNGERLPELLAELFRVTADKLVLFEPCHEIASPEGQARMERLGYIRGMEEAVVRLGGTLLSRTTIRNPVNPLNPTACFVIKPPGASPARRPASGEGFCAPGSNHPLERIDDFYFSNETGLCFPVLKSIPLLKRKCAIMASALCSSP